MVSLLDNNTKFSENNKNKFGFIIVTLFLIWLFWPNNNSFIRLCYWSDNAVYKLLKITHTNKVPEYVHYRNSAIYLAKIYPHKSAPAKNAMKRAIASVPQKMAQKELAKLYQESAVLSLYYGDKDDAMADYASASFLKDSDNFTYAVLLAEDSRFDEALSKCKEIIDKHNFIISGSVCMSYVYEKSGDIQTASDIYDEFIESHSKSVIAYMERACFRDRINDKEGAEEDRKKAKELSSYATENYTSIIDKSIHFKELPLSFI